MIGVLLSLISVVLLAQSPCMLAVGEVRRSRVEAACEFVLYISFGPSFVFPYGLILCVQH